jgi:hypothetical protein
MSNNLQAGIWQDQPQKGASTSMPNNLQAEFGRAPAAEGGKGKMQHSCFS